MTASAIWVRCASTFGRFISPPFFSLYAVRDKMSLNGGHCLLDEPGVMVSVAIWVRFASSFDRFISVFMCVGVIFDKLPPSISIVCHISF